jgi:carbon monoxide dehydrogenase subunit G
MKVNGTGTVWMQVHGTGTVRAAPDAIWAALGDARLLVRAAPGLDQVDFAGDGSCRFVLTTAITAVSGSYTGEASVAESTEPSVRVLRVSATGVKGKVVADVTIALAPAANGATELSYTADAEVEGAIAGIGQRMLVSIAKRITTDAISGLDAVLAGPGQAEETAAGSAHAEQAPSAEMTAAGSARSERRPAIGRSGLAVRAAIAAGASAAVAAIVVGVVARKRRGRR